MLLYFFGNSGQDGALLGKRSDFFQALLVPQCQYCLGGSMNEVGVSVRVCSVPAFAPSSGGANMIYCPVSC